MDDFARNVQRQSKKNSETLSEAAEVVQSLEKISRETLDSIGLLGELARVENKLVFWRTIALTLMILFTGIIIIGLYG